MISLTGFLVLSAITAFVYYFFLRNDGKNYPPGPRPLPILGNLLTLGKEAHVPLGKMADKYGDIFQVWFGQNRVYVLNDLQLMKEVFNDPLFSARYDEMAFNVMTDGPHGIINSSGQEWVEQRRFTLRTLRDFGFGKRAGEELITNEVNEFLGKFSKTLGQPITLNRSFQVAVLNTLWEITVGERYEHDDPRLWDLFNQNKELSENMLGNVIIFFLPSSLSKMFPKLTGYNKFVKLAADTKKIIMGHVNRHKETFPVDGVTRDFMDVYLKEIDATTDSNSSFYGEDGIRSLAAVMHDLFMAGFETVTLTLSWAVLYLTKFPEAQKKMQEELDRVVGRNRFPTLADRSSLPYVEATITETLRMSSIVPSNAFHLPTQDAKIRGYDTPKGTWVISTNMRLHYDEKYYPNPNKFYPDRFITKEGKFQKPDALMAFGAGKRVCLGETLARDEIFLFLTNLFHRFSIRLADENLDASMEPVVGFMLAPKDFKVVMTERN